jgi:TolB protein
MVMNADGSDVHSVTPVALEGFAPDWSPDGSRIAFTTNAARTGSRVYTVAADGSDVQPVTAPPYPANDVNAVYAPRGNRFLFGSDRDPCCFGLFMSAADGSGLHPFDVGLPEPFIFDPAWGSAPKLP